MKKELKHTMLFFVICCAWTWALCFIIIFSGLSPYEGTGMILLICGGCSPTFAGLIMAMLTFSRSEKTDYLRRCCQIKRIKPGWLLFILLIFPAVYAAGITADLLTGGTLPEAANLKAVIQSPASLIPLMLLIFMSGPFSEELGWRGYALEPLLKRFGFTKGSLILGFVWGIWHLPLFFMPETWHGQMGFKFAGFWMFMISTLGQTVIMSLVFIKTNRSILSGILLHFSLNFTGQLLAQTSDTAETAANIIAVILGAAICIYQHNSEKKHPESPA